MSSVTRFWFAMQFYYGRISPDLTVEKNKSLSPNKWYRVCDSKAYSCVNVNFESRFNNYSVVLTMLVDPNITGNLLSRNVTDISSGLINIKLDNPLYYTSQKVD